MSKNLFIKVAALIVTVIFVVTSLAACGTGGVGSSNTSDFIDFDSSDWAESDDLEDDASLSDSTSDMDTTTSSKSESDKSSSKKKSSTSSKKTSKTRSSTSKLPSKGSSSSSAKSTESTTKKTSTNNSLANKVVSKKYANGNVVKSYSVGYFDYLIEVPTGKEITVLQLTDPQIMDTDYEDRCFRYIRETINKSKPDLILITGDIVYGRYDPYGEILTAFIEFMEGFDIPWAPIYGNHDAESAKGPDWQCQQYEEAKNCLFVQRELTGNGNYTIGIKQDNTVKRMIFMMDSNCYSMMDYANDHSTADIGLKSDQKEWLTDTAEYAKKIYPDMKLTVCFHIQMSHFDVAYKQYGFNNSNTQTNPINLDTLSGVKDGDFGYLGRNFKSAWYDYTFYENIIDLGVDSFLFGHEHCNSASAVFNGVRYQFGQKSSTYDRANYLTSDGSIVGTTTITAGEPIMGGTVLKLSKADAAITDAYIQYWNK